MAKTTLISIAQIRLQQPLSILRRNRTVNCGLVVEGADVDGLDAVAADPEDKGNDHSHKDGHDDCRLGDVVSAGCGAGQSSDKRLVFPLRGGCFPVTRDRQPTRQKFAESLLAPASPTRFGEPAAHTSVGIQVIRWLRPRVSTQKQGSVRPTSSAQRDKRVQEIGRRGGCMRMR